MKDFSVRKINGSTRAVVGAPSSESDGITMRWYAVVRVESGNHMLMRSNDGGYTWTDLPSLTRDMTGDAPYARITQLRFRVL